MRRCFAGMEKGKQLEEKTSITILAPRWSSRGGEGKKN